MVRVDSIRSQLKAIVRKSPFEPFSVNFENGDRVIVEHPENIAFDSSENGINDLQIISKRLVHYATLSAVTSIAKLDQGEAAA